ncbi:MAG: T9SS C-terminal target domain-containing protein [Ignavibacteriae bacterium]|nr:MAG: T9SS C-terminal target domain-containing protein [Ignavibacteriota bacterium]
MKIRFLLKLYVFMIFSASVLIGQVSKMQADSIAADTTDMGSLPSVEFTKLMIPGWNTGNSLEATPTETSWGNPAISQQLIDSIKTAGFKSVRIPIAWSSHFSNAAAFTIDPAFLIRVENVVDYVIQAGMTAIINIHYDGGWMMPTYAQQSYVNNRLTVMWKQIAIHFRDYDNQLIFAGTNEVKYDYNPPTAEYFTVQNSFNQTFVSAVRSTGGRNVYRYLAVQGYNTNIDYTYNYFSIPQDVVQNRMLVEVHYYDPYDFTINEGNTNITQWGNIATDPRKTEVWANESYADGQFLKMKSKFIDKGYGVILGEYGAMARLNLGSDALNAEHAGYRRYYIGYVTGSMVRAGIVPYYWDNGGTGNNGLGIFYRATGAKAYPLIVKAIIDAARTNSGGTGVETRQTNSVPPTFDVSQNFPNPFNPTTVINYQLPGIGTRYTVSMYVYDLLGRQVATLAEGVKNAGQYSATFDGSKLPSGVYVVRCRAVREDNGASLIKTIKMIMTK